MASRKKMGKAKSGGKNEIECFYCGKPVAANALKCRSCGRWFSSGKKFLAVMMLAILIYAVVVVVYLPPLQSEGGGIEGDTDGDGYPDDWELTLGTDPYDPSDTPLDTDQDGKPDGDAENSEPWMDTDDDGDGIPDSEETPEIHAIGSGVNDFWINYSEQHPDSGGVVPHPQFIRNDVEKKTVILYIGVKSSHSITLQNLVNSVASKHRENVIQHNYTFVYDDIANDTAPIYDPNGGPNPPVIVLLTMDSENNIIWHSWDTAVEHENFEKWVIDAINYHK